MDSDAIVLYKLIALYMLDRVDFTLTNTQITEFVLDKGYTDYFTLQTALTELEEKKYVNVSMVRNAVHYKISDKGEEALSLLENRIPHPIKEDILEFFKNQKINLKKESEIYSDYFFNENGEYTVNCVIKERKTTLIDLSISVPTKSDARAICDHWREGSTDVYSYLMSKLLLGAKD